MMKKLAIVLFLIAGVANAQDIKPPTCSIAGGTITCPSGSLTPGTGSGTVTTVAVTTANGVSGSVANPTTTPAISLTLGAITPTTINGNTITAGTGTLTLGSVTLNAGVGGTLGSNAFTSTTYLPLTGGTLSGGLSTNSQITSTLAIGTAPFVITSTTLVPNLYVQRSVLADSATTNANLTGPITSVGNATSIASQTGTGQTFVVQTNASLITPNINVATGASLALGGGSIGSDVLETNGSTTHNGAVVIAGASFGLSGNISAPAWTTAGVRYKNISATLTDTTSSGTVAAARTDNFGGNTIAASNATTYTNYYSAYFSAPTPGTNVTFTNKSAIGADSISINGQAQSTFALAVNGTSNFTGNITGNLLIFGQGYVNGVAQAYSWLGRTLLFSDADGNMRISNNAQSSFGLLQFGGTTSSFPALKRSATGLQARLADDSGDAPFVAGTLQTLSAASLTLTNGAIGMGKMTASASAPGAAGTKLEAVCGTNAGTAKLVMYAGTSGTAVTVIDNVGTGVTGC